VKLAKGIKIKIILYAAVLLSLHVSRRSVVPTVLRYILCLQSCLAMDVIGNL
jgi:hypothetical protein